VCSSFRKFCMTEMMSENVVGATGMYRMEWLCTILRGNLALAYSSSRTWQECAAMHTNVKTRKVSMMAMVTQASNRC
jgi:hypothetical protein